MIKKFKNFSKINEGYNPGDLAIYNGNLEQLSDEKGGIVEIVEETPQPYAGYPGGQRYIIRFKDGHRHVCGENLLIPIPEEEMEAIRKKKNELWDKHKYVDPFGEENWEE